MRRRESPEYVAYFAVKYLVTNMSYLEITQDSGIKSIRLSCALRDEDGKTRRYARDRYGIDEDLYEALRQRKLNMARANQERKTSYSR